MAVLQDKVKLYMEKVKELGFDEVEISDDVLPPMSAETRAAYIKMAHLMRYAGWYSNRARGECAKKSCLPAAVALAPSDEQMATEFAARARAAWARLIRKVYEADSLQCPKCKSPELSNL